ncbi:MAG: hypothetical protein QXW56_02755 [Nitrososphaerota archaeon]
MAASPRNRFPDFLLPFKLTASQAPVSLNWFYGTKFPPRRRRALRERVLLWFHRLLRVRGSG